MNEYEDKSTSVSRLVAIFFVGAFLLAAWLTLGRAAGPVAYHLAVGWCLYPARVLPAVTIHWPAIVTAGLCLLLLGAGSHSFLKWLYANLGTIDGTAEQPERRWKPKWTASFLSIVVLMFAVGICMVGITHQAAWLFGKEPLIKHEQKRTYSD